MHFDSKSEFSGKCSLEIRKRKGRFLIGLFAIDEISG